MIMNMRNDQDDEPEFSLVSRLQSVVEKEDSDDSDDSEE